MPELIEYPCEATGCQARILRWDAICSLCHVVCCSEHNTPDHHPCQKARTKVNLANSLVYGWELTIGCRKPQNRE
ncbi:hypothetical protein I203_101640 [Kwoniella mangroviensis CBS 8507]|uniref:uncharacterized protein n=1 Tax=Kwoniella mangroviensis CBS 8507 TaxID=1296122 RepID=UPI00305222FA